MRVQTLLASLAMVGLLVSGPIAVAESPERGDLINGERVKPDSREYRVALAKSLRVDVAKLNDAVPSLSPEQKAWLIAERQRLERSDGPEEDHLLRNLTSSRAFLLERTRYGIERQLDALACIEKSEKQEMLCWVILAHSLSGSDLYEAFWLLARDHNFKLPSVYVMWPWEETPIPDTSMIYSMFPLEYGRGILEYIVIPFLSLDHVNRGDPEK